MRWKTSAWDVPEDIDLREYLGSVDQITSRPIAFDAPVPQGGRGWYFTDSDEASSDIRPAAVSNSPLYQFMEGVEREHSSGAAP